MPGTYNPARLTQRPMPLLVLVPNDEQEQSDEADDQLMQNPLGESIDTNNSNASNMMTRNEEAENDEQNTLDEMPTNSSDLNGSTNISPNNSHSEQFDEGQLNSDGAQSIAQMSLNQSSSADEVDIVFEPPTNSTIANVSDSLTSNEVIAQAIKPEPVFHSLIEANARAVEDVFNDSNANDDESNVVLANSNNVMPIVEANAQAVEDVVNGIYENCDESGEVLVCSSDILPMPIAIKNPYEVKQCDIISGNMAYATNVSTFDYMY